MKTVFNSSNKSTFPYWFAHWCAFQMTALNLGVWHFRYLFHDFEKPWMKLFMPYKKVQLWHNKHNRHHILHLFLYGGECDWEGMIIDWECGRFTKEQCPLNARQEYDRIITQLENYDDKNKTVRILKEMGKDINDRNWSDWYYNQLAVARGRLTNVLDKLGL